MSGVSPYLLTFDPILKEKVWGGRRLERYGKRLEPGKSYGESWEVADLAQTAASGGGGGEARSLIARGEMQGRAIGEAVAAWGADLLGDEAWARVRDGATASGGPAFPLLVKLLDAREHLSVQVHPSPEYAAQHDDAHLKTESWVVLEAEAVEHPVVGGDPLIYTGVRDGLSAERFREAISSGSVVEHLHAVPAVAGECHTLPSGTCHALGAGVLVLEVQTPSDTTFRVYDWAAEYGRGGRELHVEEALACISFDEPRAPAATRLGDGVSSGVLSETDWYQMGAMRVPPGGSVNMHEGQCCIVVGTKGSGWLSAGEGRAEGVDPGRTVVVPAAVSGQTRLTAGTMPLEVVVMCVK